MCEGGVLFASDIEAMCQSHAYVDCVLFVFEPVLVGVGLKTKCNLLQCPIYLICAFNQS